MIKSKFFSTFRFILYGLTIWHCLSDIRHILQLQGLMANGSRSTIFDKKKNLAILSPIMHIFSICRYADMRLIFVASGRILISE